MLNAFDVLAQTTQIAASPTTQLTAPAVITTATSQPAQQVEPPWIVSHSFPILMGAVILLYLFMAKSKKGNDKGRTDRLANLKQGDRVQTIGGIIGNVVRADDKEVVVKVDEGSNVKVRFTRSAIHRVVEDDKAETK